MLKSTYKPSAAATAPLPPGWTEHTAPTGHKYYHNADTKESTYQRPGALLAQDSPAPYAHLPSLADPNVANAYLAQIRPPQRHSHHQRGTGRAPLDGRTRPQPVDKPRRTEKIPGCEPWMLVYTKYSRRFVFNPAKNTSYWRISEKLMDGVLELDKARVRGKAAGDAGDKGEKAAGPQETPQIPSQPDDLGSDYEEVEVEVTDDEATADDNLDGEEQPSKRRKIGEQKDAHQQHGEETEEEMEEEEEVVEEEEEEDEDGPVEFTEADIAAQLQAMGEEYGLEPGDYDDGNMDDWPEGAEGVDFSEEDAKLLFKDLLNDHNVNPYSPWEALMEEGKIVDDARYTALTTTRARKETWDEWTREQIARLKDLRAKQEKKDPRVAYMAMLQQKATPKLYWAEFKRKYRKEDAMKDMHFSDKEREKTYREHIARLKMPPATLKSDLTTLLKAQPVKALHNRSSVDNLPVQILTDVRYISLDPKIRDPLVEAYIQTLPGPPADDDDGVEDAEDRIKAKEARERRRRALDERNRTVEEGKRRREKELAIGRARLRGEEKELERAMRVDKKGLQSQLADGMGES